MRYGILDEDSREAVAGLFRSVFSSSEGEEEGERIGGLASELASRADNREVICMGAREGASIVGAIFFTRLVFDEPVTVYMLAPVAVDAGHQGKGVGQALIGHGLEELRDRSVDAVVTYGDPSFYSRVGFRALSEDTLQAPRKLSMPEGWLGRSLTGGPIPTLRSRPSCVEAFDDPAYW